MLAVAATIIFALAAGVATRAFADDKEYIELIGAVAAIVEVFICI